jgi:hypothetical protein
VWFLPSEQLVERDDETEVVAGSPLELEDGDVRSHAQSEFVGRQAADDGAPDTVPVGAVDNLHNANFHSTHPKLVE